MNPSWKDFVLAIGKLQREKTEKAWKCDFLQFVTFVEHFATREGGPNLGRVNRVSLIEVEEECKCDVDWPAPAALPATPCFAVCAAGAALSAPAWRTRKRVKRTID
eukprot:scaffold1793_cov164-Ochromonas_danica.AAC.6